MFIEKIAKVVYEDGTASEDTPITVKTHKDNRVLWKGKAKELQEWAKNNQGWIVVEILIDMSDTSNTPDYNKGKIIAVI